MTTLSNWIAEIKRHVSHSTHSRFAPTVPCLLYHGNKQERAQLRKNNLKTNNTDFPWIVTGYEIVMRDRRFLQTYKWKYVVIDEGHRLKNFNCRLVRELKSIESANRLLLTGTPLQNNLMELWSLLNFLMPEIFYELDEFMKWY
jgi:ATP-dependent DNA helicase